jgi:hypothetical protein
MNVSPQASPSPTGQHSFEESTTCALLLQYRQQHLAALAISSGLLEVTYGVAQLEFGDAKIAADESAPKL